MKCEGFQIPLAILFVGIFLQNSVNGLIRIKSSIEDTADKFCSDHVSFICNAQDDQISTIQFFINNVSIANYSYDSNHEFPYNISTALPGVSVQMMQATFSGGQFNFENFTLSMDLLNLVEIEGQSLYCGISAEDQSEIITITLGNNLKVNYSAMYGFEDELTSINVSWIDMLLMGLCKVKTIYMVQLRNSDGSSLDKRNITEDCTNAVCSVLFDDFKNLMFSSYDFQIIANNFTFNFTDIFTSKSISQGNDTFTAIDFANCSLLIMCFELARTNCSVIVDSSQSRFFQGTVYPNSTYSVSFDKIPRGYVDITVETQIDSFLVIQSRRNKAGVVKVYGEVGGIQGVGIGIFVVGTLILVFGCIVGIVLGVKYKACADVGVFYGIALCAIIVSLLFWISTLILFTLGPTNAVSCTTETPGKNPYYLAATALSVALLATSIVVVGAFILTTKWNICNFDRSPVSSPSNTELVLFADECLVSFGSEQVKRKDSEKCMACNKNVKRGLKEVISRVKDKKMCHGCGKVFCESCTEKHNHSVYIPYEKDYMNVCNDCYDYLKQEKKRLSKFPSVGSEHPQNRASEKCMLCKKVPKEEKGGKSHKLNMHVHCESCGWFVCLDCMVLDEVEVGHLNKQSVCKNCFMRYQLSKIKDDDVEV